MTDSPALHLTTTLLDVAGNPTSRSITLLKDTVAPSVALSVPTPRSFINIANASSFSLSGNCSEEGAVVTIGGAVTGSASCAGGAITASLDFYHPPLHDLRLSLSTKHGRRLLITRPLRRGLSCRPGMACDT